MPAWFSGLWSVDRFRLYSSLDFRHSVPARGPWLHGLPVYGLPVHGLSIGGSCHQPHRTGDRRQVLPDPAATVSTTVPGQRIPWSDTTGYGGMVLKPIRVYTATSSTRFNHPGGYLVEAATRGRANHRRHPPAPHRKGRGYSAEAATRVPGTGTGRSHRKRSDRLEAVRTARTILRPSGRRKPNSKPSKAL